MKVYLDNNRATTMDVQVKDEILPLLTNQFASPEAAHSCGTRIKAIISISEEKIRASIHAREQDTITYGLNSDALQCKLLLSSYLGHIITGQKNQIILSASESKFVLNTAQYIASQGCRVTLLPLNSDGIVDTSMLKQLITPKTALVSVTMVDPQSGAIMPIDEISQICKEHDVPLHSDATHAVGKLPIDVQMLDIDYLSLSTSTIHGPSDTALLYIKNGMSLPNFDFSNSVGAGVVGMSKALELAVDAQAFEMEDVRELRDTLEDAIREIPRSIIITPWALRTPNTILVGFKDVQGEALAWELNRYNISVSTENGRSIVDNTGIDTTYRHTLVSFALSRYTTEEEINYVIGKIKLAVATIRTERAN